MMRVSDFLKANGFVATGLWLGDYIFLDAAGTQARVKARTDGERRFEDQRPARYADPGGPALLA